MGTQTIGLINYLIVRSLQSRVGLDQLQQESQRPLQNMQLCTLAYTTNIFKKVKIVPVGKNVMTGVYYTFILS